MALVGDARAALGAGVIGILDGGGLSRDQRVLAVVDGLRVGVGEADDRYPRATRRLIESVAPL